MKGKIPLFVALILSITVIPAFSGRIPPSGEGNDREIRVDAWLILGPSMSPLPAFQGDNHDAGIEELLKFESVDTARLRPEEGRAVTGPGGGRWEWRALKAADGEFVIPGSSGYPSTAYLGLYLDVKRWTAVVFSVKSPQAFRVFVDGKAVSTKAKVNKVAEGDSPSEGRKTSADLELETGVHCLIVKTIYDPSSHTDWRVRAALSFEEKFADPLPDLRLSPRSRMSLSKLLDGPKVTGASVSPDGKLAAVSLSKSLPPTDSSESWVELHDAEKGGLVATYRGGTSVSSIHWAPEGKRFAYISRAKDKGTIWVADLEKGTSFPLLENVANLGSFVWSPDAEFLVYSVSEKGKKHREHAKRFKNLADRQPWWREKSHLYRVNIRSGLRQRLTAGDLTASLNSFHPGGKSLLFSRTVIDYSERPFSRTELYALDLESLEANKIWEGRWFNQAQWSPSGNRILILGGPSAFGDAGINVPGGMIPNEYDTQAFLLDPVTKKVEAISRNFAPSITEGIWCRFRNCIYFVTTDKSFRRLYRYDLDKKAYSLINTGIEVIGGFDLADNAPVAVYTGSSAAVPPKAFSIELETGSRRLLKDPGKKEFAHVTLGEVKRWSFTNEKGKEIEGRVYYPPGFDPTRVYPCIVYYYGGTSPVDRGFGGRYPKNLYAAQGYIVCVLQPSGATGFGQDFSALHVNDWGRIVAGEIITGVNEFLAAHPFVDPERVGCMGASFGGFVTMLLQTKTDLFAAAIAHAGISSISSYWGEGYWGYAYSAIATAGSFPWNRRDIYIDQSPLFAADKIITPLLLLHGSADTNVPPGESAQLYTALKILGREVEYIQISDQNHHIMTYNKRILWTKSIMAWFDRWLKDQPEWWNALYPE